MANDEQQHVALPKLYGAPAYARPKVVPVAETPKPFDPDDMPLEAYQDPDERAWTSELPARAWQPGGGLQVNGEAVTTGSATAASGIAARPLRLRTLAGRFLGGGEDGSGSGRNGSGEGR